MAGAVLTLPVGHLIDKDNYSIAPGIRALEYKKIQEIFGKRHTFLFHAGYGIVQKEFPRYFYGISGFLKKNAFKLFSFDLGPAVSSVRARPDHYYHPESRPLGKKRLSLLIRERLNYVRSRFDGKVAFENLNYFPNSAYTYVCDPDFISDTVRGNGVYLVLDLAHALISAQNMKVESKAYLSSLPLERVIEVHFSGLRRHKGKLFDAHEVPRASDYKALEYLIDKLSGNFYLTVEFYRNFSVIQKIYQALGKKLVHKRA